MNNKNSISSDDIKKMNYVQFISLIQETNRCPGGKHSINKIVQNSFIDSNSIVLEVGSNTGFTSLEIARTAKCKVFGIDIEQEAVEIAKNKLKSDTQEIQNLVSFGTGSALEIPFPDNYFDLIVTGGATSFIADKQSAIKEYYRVLKPWGFLSVTNLCYINTPPNNIIEQVSKIIGVNIETWGPDEWLNLFSKQNKFELYLFEKYKLYERKKNIIDDYIDYFMQKPHLKDLSLDTKEAIKFRWRDTISVFNENHKYLGFILTLFRKAHIEEEIELFSKFSLIP